MSTQLDFLEPEVRVLADDQSASIVYRSHVLSDEESRTFFDLLLKQTPWSHDSVRMFGRSLAVPRLRASYKDVTSLPKPLLSIQQRVQAIENAAFNSVSLNLYRDARDGVAWHSDHEEAMVERPTVVIVSLGAPRTMDIRERGGDRRRWHLMLEPGSLLAMGGYAQRNFEHRIPKLNASTPARISIALRQYAPESAAPQPCAQCQAHRTGSS